MPPELLFILRPEVLAPIAFLLGLFVGFETRASVSRRRQRQARSSYLSDQMASAAWKLQPPPTTGGLTGNASPHAAASDNDNSLVPQMANPLPMSQQPITAKPAGANGHALTH
jgi:hypothetical protein